jgi:hypothetical protein
MLSKQRGVIEGTDVDCYYERVTVIQRRNPHKWYMYDRDIKKQRISNMGKNTIRIAGKTTVQRQYTILSISSVTKSTGPSSADLSSHSMLATIA